MDVSFPGKLSVITGETGAGKSIFLEAMGLALGKRAEPGVLKDKTRKCIVEAEFETEGLDLKAFFEEHDLDFEPGITLRREISPDSKSRSFLNDSPVNLAILKELSERLIDIHSQHQTLLLNQSNFQLEMVDAFTGSAALFKEYKTEFSKLNALNSKLKELQEQDTRLRKELDYHQFLYNELEEAQLVPGSMKALEEESASLENAENIRANLSSAANLINGGEQNILSGLNQTRQLVMAISKYKTAYGQLSERLNSAYIELKDIASELENEESEISFDSKRLDEVNFQLDKLQRLLKKHGVTTEEELVKIKSDLEAKLVHAGSLESEIEKTQAEIKKKKDACLIMAKKLSDLRQKAVPSIEQQVKEMLTSLAMENATFKIMIDQKPEISSQGIDEVRFLFSANKGGTLSDLHKVASGGELSRLMLSLKALLASRKKLPTIIFDEIDTGVSGEVADKIGNILLNMGNSMQVVTITHLPQMASKGNHHLFVYKKDDEDKTVSYIKVLNKNERITEIAKMLSTGNPTQTALKNAKELLKV